LADVTELQQTLGVHFKDLLLLEQALVHSSYINENPGAAPTSNERLEFLGDAVLGAVFAEKLYQLLPDAAEGEMTRLRAALVRRATLSRVARAFGLDRYLYLGKGEEASGGRYKPSNLAGALEAVIAAVFLDRGWGITTDFILRLFKDELDELDRRGLIIDYKSRLQHLIQSRQGQMPAYHITETSGPSHKPLFTAEVTAGDTVLGRGCGSSKKIAQTEAARSALEQLE
jgi:ribonuclease-3